MLLPFRKRALKGKRVTSVGGKGSSAQLILTPAKQHHVKHPAGGSHILPGEKPCQIRIAALQHMWKTDHRRAVIPGNLTRHTDTALRRQRRKYRVDHHGLGGVQLNDPVLHAGYQVVVLRLSVDQQICQQISLGRTHGQFHCLPAAPSDSQLVQGKTSTGNPVGYLDHMHVFVRQRGKSLIVLRSLVVPGLPSAVFHVRAQGVQAGTGSAPQPVQVKAECVNVVYNIVIAGVVFDHPDIDDIAPHGFHPIPPQHVMPERLVKIQGIISQRLPAAVQIGSACDTHTVKFGRALHIAHTCRWRRVVDPSGEFHIHGVGIAGRLDVREENSLSVLRRSAHRPNAVLSALQAGQIPAVGFCVAVGGVSQLCLIAAYIDITVLVEQQCVVHTIVIHLRESRL